MSLITRSTAALTLLLSSLSLHAAGLGNPELLSHIGQPLKLNIPVVRTEGEDLELLHFRIAPKKVYQQMDIEFRHQHNNLEFSLNTPEQKPMLLVTTHRPIHEPFLNFIIEAQTPSGTLYKEISVLLDTPQHP